MLNEKMKKSISILRKLDRGFLGELAITIGNNAIDDCIHNDMHFINLLCKYREDNMALDIINQTLVSICGLSIADLLATIQVDDEIDELLEESDVREELEITEKKFESLRKEMMEKYNTSWYERYISDEDKEKLLVLISKREELQRKLLEEGK